MISNNCTRNDIPTPIALEFRDMSISRGTKRIIKSMSLNFPAGTVSGFYGDNGCGKSSVLKAAAGLLRDGVQGKVIWFERELELTDRLRRRVGFQLQSAPVFTNLTVKEQLRLAAQNRLGDARKLGGALECIFEYFPVLAQRQTTLASKLNGGTRRILAIGLACVGLIDGLLILDEPTNDLSRESASDLSRAIRRLAERDRNAVIVVSHDFHWLRTTSDRKLVYTLRNKPKEVPSTATANEPPTDSTESASAVPESTVPVTTVPETSVAQNIMPQMSVPESAVPESLISLPLHIDRVPIDLWFNAAEVYPTKSANDLALSFLMTPSDCYDLIALHTHPALPNTFDEIALRKMVASIQYHFPHTSPIASTRLLVPRLLPGNGQSWRQARGASK